MKRNITLCVLLVSVILLLCACSNSNSGNRLKVNTNAGEVSAADWNNWEKYEVDVIKKVKLDKETQDSIDKKIDDYTSGRMTEAEIKEIDTNYDSIESYKEHLEINAKKIKAIDTATKDIEVTDKDREVFLSKYSKAFAGKNAIILQFDNSELAAQYVESNRYSGADAVLSFVESLSENKNITWEDINKLYDKTGITLLHNGDSNKYNYCQDNTLAEIFLTLADGQTSEPFIFGEKSTVMIRVSDNCVEKDDALVDNYMLKIKKEEAYRKYIIDNK